MGVLEKEPSFYLGAAATAQVRESHTYLIQKKYGKCRMRSITGLKIEDGI
jgi:hypothetical protein